MILSMIRGDFEPTIVWSRVIFERSIVWSEVILSAKLSRQWSGSSLGHSCTVVWTLVWFWSDQRSFPSGNVWAYTLFHSSFSLISGHWSEILWSEVTFVWQSLIRVHFRINDTSTWVRNHCFCWFSSAKTDQKPLRLLSSVWSVVVDFKHKIWRFFSISNVGSVVLRGFRTWVTSISVGCNCTQSLFSKYFS